MYHGRKSYRFGTTWEWINDDSEFTFLGELSHALHLNRDLFNTSVWSDLSSGSQMMDSASLYLHASWRLSEYVCPGGRGWTLNLPFHGMPPIKTRCQSSCAAVVFWSLSSCPSVPQTVTQRPTIHQRQNLNDVLKKSHSLW